MQKKAFFQFPVSFQVFGVALIYFFVHPSHVASQIQFPKNEEPIHSCTFPKLQNPSFILVAHSAKVQSHVVLGLNRTLLPIFSDSPIKQKNTK